MTDEQKNAIDHAQKILRAVKLYDLAAALESRVLAGRTPAAEVIKWQTFTGHTAWDFKVFDKTLEHGTKLFTHPAPDDARKESK